MKTKCATQLLLLARTFQSLFEISGSPGVMTTKKLADKQDNLISDLWLSVNIHIFMFFIKSSIGWHLRNMADNLQCYMVVHRTPFFLFLNTACKFTSCGGTSKDIVLRSTTLMSSRHGRMKKRPGPLASPGNSLPARNITARSYSDTICDKKRTIHFERGYWFY